MRIAVSGTHGVGKSTLIDEFLATHPEFAHEPEAYTVLVEDFGEEFSSIPAVDDFRRQLEFHIERLRTYRPGEKVIYERSPVDYLAYVHALEQLGRERVSPYFLDKMEQSVIEASAHLDLIVFLPLETQFEILEDEDLELRRTVDQYLIALFDADQFGPARAVTTTGTTAQRLRTIETAIAQGISNTQPLDGSQRITS